MQRHDDGNGTGRDLSRAMNGHGAEIRRRAQARAQQRLQRLYRLAAARQYRDRAQTTNRFKTPLIVGSSLLVGMIGLGLMGIFVLIQGAATGYAMLTRDLPSLTAISNHASF